MSGWFGGILGQREAPPAAEVLIERLQDSHKIEDRRKTIADLKSVESKENHAVIGKAIPVFINLLKSDRADTDIIRDTLELLISIMTCIPGKDNSTELQNTDIFIKDTNNLTTVLSLLEERDYYIRFSTTQFVMLLLSNRSAALQDAILLSPMGILRLMDLLGDQREAIRNEVLLLLLELTQTHQEIQKLVAFEGAFEKLLGEGAADGGIIVQDCLRLINNLLRANVSNQNYFRENNCIKRLPSLLEVQNSDMFILTDSKHAILMLTLDLISLLVQGSNPSSYSCQDRMDWGYDKNRPDNHKNQTVLAQNNLIGLVVRLALGRMYSHTIRSKGLQTLGELIRGHADNLAAFAALNILNISTTTKQTQSTLMKLVLVLLTSKDLGERLAALHTFQCYLASNEEGQLALASTVTPPPTNEDEPEMPPSSIGGHLLRALLGWVNSPNPDSFSAWLSAYVMSAILKENNASKELLLRIPLEIPKPSAPLVTLMSKAMRSLSQSDRLQADPLIRVGLLRMLCIWLDHSPASVKNRNLPFLVEVVLQPTPPPPSPAPHVQGLAALMIVKKDETGGEFNRNSLNGIIMHRIGEKYYAKLEALRKTEDFTFAEQGNQDKDPSIRYYDYDFTIFYKDSFDKIQRELRKGPGGGGKIKDRKNQTEAKPPHSPTPAVGSGSHPSHPSPPQSDAAVLASYKELVRRLESELSSIQGEQQKVAATFSQKDAEILRLAADLERAQQALVVANNEAHSHQHTGQAVNQAEAEEQARILTSLSQAYNQLQDRLHAKEDEVASLTKQLSQVGLSSEVQQLFVEDTDSASASSLFDDTEKQALKKQVAALQDENKLLQVKLAEKPAPTSPPTALAPNPQVIEDNRRLHEQLTQISGQYNQLYAQYGQLINENARIANTLAHFSDENAKLKQTPTPASPTMNAQVQQLTSQNTQLNNNVLTLQSQLQQSQAQLQQLQAQLQQSQQAQAQLQQVQAQLQQVQAQLQQAQARVGTLETTLQEKEREVGRKSPMPTMDNSNLRIAKLEMQLKERDAKYESLEREQSDLVQCLTNTELENITLKERIKLLEGSE